ncbi:acyl-phosphate glycerol-3-phosphate acyltransferase [Streptohalobacillus salinus]|uniref:Glycerol-3-phosphate acyltransferase n=1 Tax=Streptohalobacillus salinus TaxID=621096 RepID=A0A2V3WFE4_9BACI|nr:glycerol-3-phosphate 1-O-acyltransferase PlsY [Streptohalobacillus salinus]PXW91858.1 acyl-phosphate glycerol-3-phosphate acyltransferase [Streptohalobacillus salinus]
MWQYVIFILIAYLLGSIPSGLIVGKAFYNVDIREHGSGNLGGTNTFRVLGKKAGMIVTISDVLKGTISVLLPMLFDQVTVNPLIIGVFAVIGHIFPLFANFKGGKAVATSGGLILALSPLLFFIILATFFLSLYITKYVSLSSMVTGFIAMLTTFVLDDIGLMILTAVLFIFIVYRHIPNIKRIKNKTEPKITWI